MGENAQDLAYRLRITRKSRGLKREDVYLYVGVGRTTYSQWESGARNPSRKSFDPLCRVLGVTSDWLLFGRLDGLPHGLVLKLQQAADEK